MANRDTEHLLQVAKTEKTPEFRLDAIRFVGSSGGGDALVPIYASDQDRQVKQTIVETLFATAMPRRWWTWRVARKTRK